METPRKLLYELIIKYERFYGLTTNEAIKMIRKDLQAVKIGD